MSQTATKPGTKFQLADEDKWDVYIKHRPAYPDSMFQRWLDYHGKDNKLESVHDLGTGGGVGALAFLKALPRLRGGADVNIKTFHLSDPGQVNISAARRNLNPERFPGINFTFHEGPGEEPNPNVAPGSLDMVMACECLHWTHIEPTMRNIAESLRPGGTFVTVLYFAIPRIIGNPAASQAQQDVGLAWRRLLIAQGDEPDLRAQMQVAVGLDYVPMYPDVWEPGSVVRYYCNIRNREWAFEEMLSSLTKEEIAANRPRIWANFETEKEEVVEEDMVDWGRRGIGMKEVKQYWEARMPGDFLKDLFETAEWKALEKAVEDGGGKCDVEIPMLMIMGKKRM